MILSGWQHQSGVVLHVLVLYLVRGVDGQLYGVANLSSGKFSVVGDESEDVERGFVLIAIAAERNLRSGHDKRDRYIESVFGHTEVSRPEINGQIGRGQLSSEFFL